MCVPVGVRGGGWGGGGGGGGQGVTRDPQEVLRGRVSKEHRESEQYPREVWRVKVEEPEETHPCVLVAPRGVGVRGGVGRGWVGGG